ncbi:hypothetical protein QAD02_018269 [Eretmocerus hayati]|uniref:Uncharacterized protein n=1 Tax=Eretmocerus hayati TaxID=131215 RepID=A0ACC2PGK1_9HYME|nr:hypothetical protein QAD02_018269 [Eretmocerus hayati]
MPEKIKICIIPQDLRQEETIVQIAEALDDLNFAVSHIFDSINERIRNNTNRLHDIQSRAAKLQGQLNHLQTNLNLKAVKVYSAAKYPANHTYREYELAVKGKQRKVLPVGSVYKSPVPLADEPKSSLAAKDEPKPGESTNDPKMQEKLQFYYVKSKTSDEGKANQKKYDQIRTNKRVLSVSSLLPLYKNVQDPTDIQINQGKEKSSLEDAPDSIVQPWLTSDIQSPSAYMYAPTLGEVPQMNVPLTLPDLPGIVDDEGFVLEPSILSPIAPSSSATTPTARKDPPSEPDPAPQAIVSKPAPSTTVQAPQPKLEPSVPPAPAPQARESHDELPETEKPKETTKTQVSKKPPAKVSAGDDRSNLMAAIRNAGGLGKAKLRQTIKEDKPKERYSSASVGGDLMADLHATLSLRRKGIAGSAVGTLQRLSSMIPPPPKPSDASDRNSATSESQDDDGWD